MLDDVRVSGSLTATHEGPLVGCQCGCGCNCNCLCICPLGINQHGNIVTHATPGMNTKEANIWHKQAANYEG